jgi:hypothetical protein
MLCAPKILYLNSCILPLFSEPLPLNVIVILSFEMSFPEKSRTFVYYNSGNDLFLMSLLCSETLPHSIKHFENEH